MAVVIVLSLLSIFAFYLAGPLVSLVIMTSMVVAAVTLLALEKEAEPAVSAEDSCILLVANHALASSKLRQAILEKHNLAEINLSVIIPIRAENNLSTLTDDIDASFHKSQLLEQSFTNFMEASGVKNCGVTLDIEASPLQAVLDGVRSRPINKVILAHASDESWPESPGIKQLSNYQDLEVEIINT